MDDNDWKRRARKNFWRAKAMQCPPIFDHMLDCWLDKMDERYAEEESRKAIKEGLLEPEAFLYGLKQVDLVEKLQEKERQCFWLTLALCFSGGLSLASIILRIVA